MDPFRGQKWHKNEGKALFWPFLWSSGPKWIIYKSWSATSQKGSKIMFFWPLKRVQILRNLFLIVLLLFLYYPKQMVKLSLLCVEKNSIDSSVKAVLCFKDSYICICIDFFSFKSFYSAWVHSISEYAGSENFGVGKIANFQNMGSSLVNIHFWWVGVSYYFFCYETQVHRDTIYAGLRGANFLSG